MKTFVVVFCVLAVSSAAPTNWLSAFLPPEDYLSSSNAQAAKAKPANPIPVLKAKPGYPSGLYPGPTPNPSNPSLPVRVSNRNQISTPVEQPAPATAGNGLDWLNLLALGSQNWGNQDWFSGFLPPQNAQAEKTQPGNPVASYPAPAPTPAVVAAPAYQPAPVRQSTGNQESAPVEQAVPVTSGNPFDFTSLMGLMSPANWGNTNWLSGFQNYVPPVNAHPEKVQPGYPVPVPAPAPAVIAAPAYEPAPVRESTGDLVSAPLVQAAPATAVNAFDLTSLIAMGGEALSKSTDSFNSLMKGLPTALQNIDPSIKSDVGKVNAIIAQVCSQIVETGSGSEPSTFSYFSAEGLKSTCDYINKVANQIEAGLEDPGVTQYYVDAINKPVKALQEQAKIYSV